jgi:hypothetical protein
MPPATNLLGMRRVDTVKNIVDMNSFKHKGSDITRIFFINVLVLSGCSEKRL